MKTIVTAGKGGTGKSVTLASLLIHFILPRTNKRILVVDADPHQSLTLLLAREYGFKPPRSLGDLKRDQDAPLRSGRGLENVTRDELAQVLVEQALVDLPGGQLLIMGESRQPGCQCVVNSLLGNALDALQERFDLAFIDNEAGVEQIGRHYGWPVDTLLLFCRPRSMDLDVAARIIEQAHAVERPIGQSVLVINGLQVGRVNMRTALPRTDHIIYLPFSFLLETTEQADSSWLDSLGLLTLLVQHKGS